MTGWIFAALHSGEGPLYKRQSIVRSSNCTGVADESLDLAPDGLGKLLRRAVFFAVEKNR